MRKDHPPQEAYIPDALAKLLVELGWSPGKDERGAEVWYPPAATAPQVKPRHHDSIFRGIEAVIRGLPEGGVGNAGEVSVMTKMVVEGGSTGIKTSSLEVPIAIGEMEVTGPGNIGIDLDEKEDPCEP